MVTEMTTTIKTATSPFNPVPITSTRLGTGILIDVIFFTFMPHQIITLFIVNIITTQRIVVDNSNDGVVKGSNSINAKTVDIESPITSEKIL